MAFIIVLHYLGPPIVGACFACAILARFCGSRQVFKTETVARRPRLAIGLSAATAIAFGVELIFRYVQSAEQPKTASGSWLKYLISSILLWSCFVITLIETGIFNRIAFTVAWLVAAIIDAFIIFSDTGANAPRKTLSILIAVTHALRLSLIIGLVIHTCFSSSRVEIDSKNRDGETESLLRGEFTDGSQRHSSLNGGTSLLPSHDDSGGSEYVDDSGDDDDDELKELQNRRLEEEGGWWGYLKSFLVLLPHVWPYDDRHMQWWLAIMITCIVVERVLMVLIPRQLGIIADALAYTMNTGEIPWQPLLAWIALQVANIISGSALLHSMATSRFWQFAEKRLKAESFRHVMGLSMDYHTDKSSGELMKAMEQGMEITSLLDTVLFDAVPVLLDLIVAAVYLSTVLDGYMGLIIAATSVAYMYASIRGSGLIAPARREFSQKGRVENKILYDTVSNWQTVSQHNRQNLEQKRFEKAVDDTLLYQRRYWDWSDYLSTVQQLLMLLGLLAASFLVAYRISAKASPVGSFVLLITYWASIQEPMNRLSWAYRETASHLINAERLLQLLRTQPSVRDKASALRLPPGPGRVEFKDVSFSYDPRNPILNSVSFTADKGQVVAFVGATGGGKSTVFKLLYRFYDVTSGSIEIDGQDVRDLTLDSLRDALGVVPQDPSLFSLSILENVRYGNPDASDAEVYDVCRAVSMHEKILSFPDGYLSQIGERGVRLSGGERQRIAIARVLLRQPRIVLLDEATSAVDTKTEAAIQDAFRRLSAGKTTFVIAHRLSTIMNADIILVVDKGRIIERGSHAELIKRRGKYFELSLAKEFGQD